MSPAVKTTAGSARQAGRRKKAASAKKKRAATKASLRKALHEGVVRFPDAYSETVILADWLELVALCSKDGNASKVNLERAVMRAGVFEPHRANDQAEQLALAVFAELETRATAAGDAYPFKVAHPLIQLKTKRWAPRFSPYVFCLCLSSLHWANVAAEAKTARRLFEDLACFVAKNFLAGEVARFASPRDELPSAFDKAVEEICRLIGEGEGYYKQDFLGKKDDRLDVVAWRHFPDKKQGRLLLFGHCASGDDWKEKTTELDPRNFCSQWMKRPPVSQILTAFFVPHRMDTVRWEQTHRDAGITFDRCRVAYWASQGKPMPKHDSMTDWAESVLEECG